MMRNWYWNKISVAVEATRKRSFTRATNIELPQPPVLPELQYRVPEAEIIKRRY